MQLRKPVHPRKLRRALQRRWFERRMSQVPTEPYPRLVELGTDWGRWIVPDDLIDESWTCYSVGAGSDVSFDLALMERYGARVRCIDPFHVSRRRRTGPYRCSERRMRRVVPLSATNLYRTERLVTKPGRPLPS